MNKDFDWIDYLLNLFLIEILFFVGGWWCVFIGIALVIWNKNNPYKNNSFKKESRNEKSG